ncbi:hypothetical protein IC213_18855 [Clostridioides sp. ES-S-0049-02]|uniref:hypothetical protein n=1 Tax=Clostridioides sp. ES-S-0049-02 TaxID=2770778 RepID=UPI001D10FE0C|nr:hypothetical protein [Clostridioides sp. ES-S-0049-02]
MRFNTDIVENKDIINEIINYCGGVLKLEDWVKEVENRVINNIKELEKYPLKRNYMFRFSKEESSNLSKLIDKKLYDNDISKYQICDLEKFLDMLKEESEELNKEDFYYEDKVGWIENCKKELIKLKLGSVCIDW